MPEQWEYIIDTFNDGPSESDLDRRGAEGWELVAVETRTWDNERKGYRESATTCYFKRRA